MYPVGFPEDEGGVGKPTEEPAMVELTGVATAPPLSPLRLFLSPVKDCTTAVSSREPGGICGDTIVPAAAAPPPPATAAVGTATC